MKISMKSKTKVLILLTLLIIFLFSGIFNSRFSKNIITNKQSLEFKEKDQVQINQSGFWDLTGNPIYIDDLATGVGAHNWTWAETQPWCSGSGYWTDPYIIENVTINGQGSGSCIEIKNSDTYFIIQNCTVYNSGSVVWDAGVMLDNVDNGKIINNNCSDNDGNGICLYDSHNNTISGNNANNNWNGILLYDSDNNTISGNNASNNPYGIFLLFSNKNTLSGNNANNNQNGIRLFDSNDNTLSGNIASNNYDGGIHLDESNNNTLLGNLMNFCGIFLSGSLAEISSHIVDNTNLVNNKPVYYYVNETGLGSSNFTNAGQIILINCSNSIISGLNLSYSTTGIHLYYSNNNTLSGNTANNNNRYGIHLYDSDNNTLSGNNASNNDDGGIYLHNSDNSTLSGNNASNNNGEGIRLSFTKNNMLSGNLMNFCGIFLSGYLAEVASHIIDNTNLVNNKSVYYYVNEIGLGSKNFTNAGQIILINCNNSIFSGFNLSNCTTGIYLYYSNNNTISGNNASNNNYDGIWLGYSDNNTLSGNIASNNKDQGIFLGYSVNNTLSGNTASNNTYGIWLDESNNNTLSGNTASNNTNYGIRLHWHCDNNELSGNTASNNNDYGIYLFWGSDNNTLSGNTVNNNSYGIWLDYNSDTNKIFLNHFVNNEINAEDNGINNKWDNGIIGNYWDDYDGVDANDDGIGDTPYLISGTAGSQDNFPIWSDGDEEIPEDLDGLPIISFGNYYLIFTFITITILSLIILEKQKKK